MKSIDIEKMQLQFARQQKMKEFYRLYGEDFDRFRLLSKKQDRSKDEEKEMERLEDFFILHAAKFCASSLFHI